MRRTLTAGLAIAAAACPLFADFSYQETTKITGGMMAGMMKVAGVFSKQAREPIESTVAVKGNRMAHRGKLHGSIIDLDSRTITEIDMQKKTYSVITFDQMKQMLDQMSQKMQDKKSDTDMQMKVSANATGNSKQIGGYDAREMLVKIEMQATDQKSGQTGSMLVTTDLWVAGGISGYKEVREFYKKMAEELNWTPGSGMFAAQPQVSKGMAEAMKEIAKLDGTPVFQTMAMGPMGAGSSRPADTQAAPPPQQDQQQATKPSIGGALGSALGGRFGRKKSQPDQQQQSTGSGSGSSGNLIEMTTEYSGFSSAAADSSLFEVPAGFKKVEANQRSIE
jgi:hypothetical protein